MYRSSLRNALGRLDLTALPPRSSNPHFGTAYAEKAVGQIQEQLREGVGTLQVPQGVVDQSWVRQIEDVSGSIKAQLDGLIQAPGDRLGRGGVQSVLDSLSDFPKSQQQNLNRALSSVFGTPGSHLTGD